MWFGGEWCPRCQSPAGRSPSFDRRLMQQLLHYCIRIQPLVVGQMSSSSPSEAPISQIPKLILAY